MGVLYIAIGNPLRGDDGVAHRVLELIAPGRSVTKCSVLQLTPELACEVARAETVVFIDADVSGAEPRMERVITGPLRGTPLAHSMTPAEVVFLAERLYGFTGATFVCHVPAARFEGERLSPEAERNARASATLVRALLRSKIGKLTDERYFAAGAGETGTRKDRA